MRYVLAMLLVLGIGVAAAMPAALAANNADPACYQNGVAVSCTGPGAVRLEPASGSGSLAGSGQAGSHQPLQQIRVDDGDDGGQ